MHPASLSLRREIELFLSGRKSGPDFDHRFGLLYDDLPDDLPDADWQVFEDINEALGWFQPNPAMRAREPGLIGEDELRQVLAAKLEALPAEPDEDI